MSDIFDIRHLGRERLYVAPTIEGHSAVTLFRHRRRDALSGRSGQSHAVQISSISARTPAVVRHFSSPVSMTEGYPASAKQSFPGTGTPVRIGEKDVEEVFLPTLRGLPVKVLAAMTGLSDRAIVKLRNRDSQPSLLTALKLCLGDPQTLARLDQRLRGDSALLKQQIAETDLKIAQLEAKRKELIDATNRSRADQQRSRVAEQAVQRNGGSAQCMGGLVARLGRS